MNDSSDSIPENERQTTTPSNINVLQASLQSGVPQAALTQSDSGQVSSRLDQGAQSGWASSQPVMPQNQGMQPGLSQSVMPQNKGMQPGTTQPSPQNQQPERGPRKPGFPPNLKLQSSQAAVISRNVENEPSGNVSQLLTAPPRLNQPEQAPVAYVHPAHASADSSQLAPGAPSYKQPPALPQNGQIEAATQTYKQPPTLPANSQIAAAAPTYKQPPALPQSGQQTQVPQNFHRPAPVQQNFTQTEPVQQNFTQTAQVPQNSDQPAPVPPSFSEPTSAPATPPVSAPTLGDEAVSDLRSALHDLRKQTLDNATKSKSRPAISNTAGSKLVDSLETPSQDALAVIAQAATAMDAARLVADQKRKELLIYGGLGIVGLGLIMVVVSSAMHWPEVGMWSRRACFLLPVCLFYGSELLCKRLARHNPALAQKVMFFTMKGNSVSALTIAAFHRNQGDWQEAEKVLTGSVKKIHVRKLTPYIRGHAFLAAVKARGGKVQESIILIKQVYELAESNFSAVPTPAANSLLAETALYAAEVCDQRETRNEECLALSARAVELLCKQKTPPAELYLQALINVGYYCNQLNRSAEAIPFLEKANEIATTLPDCPDYLSASILTSLGDAHTTLKDFDAADGFFKQALDKASQPQGKARLHDVQAAQARLRLAQGDLPAAGDLYEAAVESCSVIRPDGNIFRVRLLFEYQQFLNRTANTDKASKLELEATQLKYNMQQKDQMPTAAEMPKLTAKAAAVIPKKKQRFPIFWTIFAIWECHLIWQEGIRMAPFANWVMLITASTVVALKLRAKYGPPCGEEDTCAPLVSIAHALPVARSLLAELAVLPQRTVMIVAGVAVVVAAAANFSKPAPNTVPSWGYLPQEYLALGLKFTTEENFTKAQQALQLVVAADPNGANGKKAKAYIQSWLPAHAQPEEAISLNQTALKTIVSDPDASEKTWKDLEKKYPTFEAPYIHLADVFRRKRDYKSAEAQLKQALVINPNSFSALMGMGTIKTAQGDIKAMTTYSKKAMKVSGEDGTVSGQLSNWAFESLEKSTAELEAKRAARAKLNGSASGKGAKDASLLDRSADESITPDE